MVGKYGVYGGQIWGLWWANMGSMVGKYGVLKNKALQKSYLCRALYGGQIWGVEK
jgi:hypothetical protein